MDNEGLRHSLAWRLTATYLLITLLILLALSLAVYLSTAFYLEERLADELAFQADFYASYAGTLASDERRLAVLAPTIVNLFASQTDFNVRFFAAGNGVLLAATQDIGSQPSQAAWVALRYRSPTLFTPASRDLPDRRYAARVIAVGDLQSGEIIGVVEVSRSTIATERFLSTLRRILLAALAAGLAMSALVSAMLGRRLSHPIRAMEAATRRIAAGDLRVRLDHDAPDEIGRLAEGINHMAEQLNELELARTRFISEVAHDLRTPLTGIKGLLVNLIDSPDPDEAGSLKVAEEETDRLIRLVNQLLDFSRWQAGRLELNTRPIDVGAVASSAVALCEARARHRNLTLKAEIPEDVPAVSADPDRLERVILNLLDNAVKFTPAGGQVTLSVVARTSLPGKESRSADYQHLHPRTTKGEIEICIEDTGRGMNQEEHERAFEAYYRGERGGTGLGLSIARAIVEAHGGRMGIESRIGQGSRVWFTLPV